MDLQIDGAEFVTFSKAKRNQQMRKEHLTEQIKEQRLSGRKARDRNKKKGAR